MCRCVTLAPNTASKVKFLGGSSASPFGFCTCINPRSSKATVALHHQRESKKGRTVKMNRRSFQRRFHRGRRSQPTIPRGANMGSWQCLQYDKLDAHLRKREKHISQLLTHNDHLASPSCSMVARGQQPSPPLLCCLPF